LVLLRDRTTVSYERVKAFSLLVHTKQRLPDAAFPQEKTHIAEPDGAA
jgi:hypothetical protein